MGWTYDTTEYAVVVTVDDADGQLEAGVAVTEAGADEPAEVVFDNQYKALSTNAVISGEKTVNTGAPDSQFTFVLLDENGNELQTKSMIGDGEFSFDPIPYEEEGVYTYTVVERSNNATGWTYDDTVYTVIVTVKDVDGQLTPEVSCTTADGATDSVVFTNNYKALSTSLILGGIKNVSTGAPDSEFEFTLKNESGEVVNRKTITGAGRFQFDELVFDMPGTYRYSISEIAGNEAGWTYDDAVYQVVVTVQDVDGQLEAVAHMTADGQTCEEIVFQNDYEKPEIPATGQNWMIVFALGAAGILLIAGASAYSHAKRKS